MGNSESLIIFSEFPTMFLSVSLAPPFKSVRRPFLLSQFTQQIIRWRKEKRPRYRCTEIEQTVGIACRTTDKHILQHPASSAERTCIPYKIGTILPFRGIGKRHIGTYNLQIITILVTALCAFAGFSSSDSSTSLNLWRPITFSCCSTGSAFHATIS